MTRVLITGCDEGIGRGFAEACLVDGCDVIATYRDLGNKLPDAARLTQFQLDVTQIEQFAAVKAALGETPIDLLISNAAIAHDPMVLGSLDFEFARKILDINTLGPLRLVETFANNVAASEQRKIVMITSRMGSIASNISGAHYVYRASKAGLNAMARSLAIDLYKRGIIVSLLHPGGVKTRGGNATAPLTVAESVRGMRMVIDRLGAHETGQYYTYAGLPLPW